MIKHKIGLDKIKFPNLLISNSNKEELAEEIRDYIFDEWEVWNPIAPNIHMLYINFK